MPEPPTTDPPTTLSPPLAQLQATLEREIPLCAMMGIRFHEYGPHGLVVRCPLEKNRNPHQTAFAGSLNALCTIAGWGTARLLLLELERTGNLVIRRSSIRYQLPVDSPMIFARCHPVTEEARDYFLEMLDQKGQAKLDLTVEISGGPRPAVVFHGSYVVAREAGDPLLPV